MIAGDTLRRWCQLPAPLGTVALAHAEQLQADTGVDDDEALRLVLDDLDTAARREQLRQLGRAGAC